MKKVEELKVKKVERKRGKTSGSYSLEQYLQMVANGTWQGGEVDGFGYVDTNSNINYYSYSYGDMSWPFATYANPNYQIDTNKPLGSYYNPCTFAQYTAMLNNATWGGGYVKGTSGYQPSTNVVFASGEGRVVYSMTYSDWITHNNNIADSIIISLINGIPGVIINYVQANLSSMKLQMIQDILNAGYVAQSVLVFVYQIETGGTSGPVMSIAAYNGNTGQLVTRRYLNIIGYE